jgi:hypothetical protein
MRFVCHVPLARWNCDRTEYSIMKLNMKLINSNLTEKNTVIKSHAYEV